MKLEELSTERLIEEKRKIEAELSKRHKIDEQEKNTGNISWGAYDLALSERQLKQLNNEVVKFKTNNNDLSRLVREAEELSRKILGSRGVE